MARISTDELLEILQSKVKDVILECLKKPAVAHSSFEQKTTGNAYQPVRLGSEMSRGFRVTDRHVWTGFNLERKKVIDLGCNLGEIVRDAIRAGAALAEGIEYDAYFVQVARYVAVFNKFDNARYTQGDLTNADTYQGRYDFVSALSVFTYIKNHLDRIAAMTKDTAIIETHSIKVGWQKQYLEPLKKSFPHVALVDISDHRAAAQTEVRYVFYCSEKSVEHHVIRRSQQMNRSDARFTVDLTKSKLRQFDQFFDAIGVSSAAPFRNKLEASSKKWNDLSVHDVIASVTKHGLISSPEYWAALLMGFLEYEKSGAFDGGNFYYQVVSALRASGNFKNSFKAEFKSDEHAIARYGRRVSMIKRAERGEMNPIVVFNPLLSGSHAQAGRLFHLHLNEAKADVYPMAFDGHHRLFISTLMNDVALPVLPVWLESGPTVYSRLEDKPDLKHRLWDDVYSLTQLFVGN